MSLDHLKPWGSGLPRPPDEPPPDTTPGGQWDTGTKEGLLGPASGAAPRAAPAVVPAPDPDPSVSDPLRPFSRWRILAASVFVLLVVGLVVGWRYHTRPRPLLTLRGHPTTVITMALSPDCRLLASGSQDGTAQVWDLATGQPRRTFRQQGGVCALAFGDSDFLALGGASGVIQFWEPTTGQDLGSCANPDITDSVALAPGGKLMAASSWSGPVPLFDVQQYRVRRWLIGHRGPVRVVSFSPDGRTLASGGFDGTIRLWDIPSGRCLATIPTFTPNECLAFSPDSKLVAAESGLSLRFWDARTGKERRVFCDTRSGLESVQFSPDGELLATVMGDSQHQCQVALWDVASGWCLATVPGAAPVGTKAVFSRDGEVTVHGLA